MIYKTRLIKTPIGEMIAMTNGEVLTSLHFTYDAYIVHNSRHSLLLRLEEELHEYFDGKRQTFTLPLAAEGTAFQQKVWETLRSIPYGQTISYAQEAQQFGNPKAVRAVANANGKNPIAILIPCHRVIATGGGLGGYSGGLWRKEFLLQLESDQSSR
ncbi:MAG: methylated-DNA--[protein]-cysteine S-methyltransferase [Sulfuricurvum sp.]|uniref:methylated-DNA--[protein]-cysteine S-methyltransferase n=1 Tax=Sulfuricurvum sp. TaxID=2025608 RepID=UPI00263655A6|nr:methylated-DNA--[protein]-cysteine S-methyltransferase [Sulfuricurvum sp.]MDD5117866.1 methylated-DNA--[protein]-cysteine S-methyltransferase [Sulfuricurvum sp.]